MKLEIHALPTSGNKFATSLVFSWDSDSGEVSGPDADLVRSIAAQGGVQGHPYPRHVGLGPDPLRSKRDMAAIIGSAWRLPAELAPHYPRLRGNRDPYVRDGEGNVIGEVCS